MKAAMMDELRKILTNGKGPWPAVAVIVDEVQNITNAIAVKSAQNPTLEDRSAANYFETGWASWNTRNSCFVRMDIASSHGTRELKLPSGDTHRLRFVGPWPLDIARAALSHSASPAFVKQSVAYSRILYTAGGVIRRLLECKTALSSDVVTKKGLAVMEHSVRNAMMDDCQHGLQKQLNDGERLYLAQHILPLLRGQLSWTGVKGAYDYGLVARDESGLKAIPVSLVAGSVLHQELAKVLRSVRIPASGLGSSERGFELERQVRIRLDPYNGLMRTMNLNGTEGPAIDVVVDHSIVLDKLDETVSTSLNSILYIPKFENSKYDAIIVPGSPDDDGDLSAAASAAAGAASNSANDSNKSASTGSSSLVSASTPKTLAPLQVWEISVKDPRDSDRIENILPWFQQGGCIPALQALHSGRQIIIVLCWPDIIRKSSHSKYHDLEEAAKKANVRVLIVDNRVLEPMGIVLSKPAAQL